MPRRALQILLVFAIVANVAIAVIAWPTLPERIPIHFDAAGNADGWAARSPWVWFTLPALGAAIGAGLGLLLPALTMRMARANSPWLNVPDKKVFAALPAEARERVAASAAAWLAGIAVCVQVVMGWILFGSARVAMGEWRTLPTWPTFALLGAILGGALGLTIALHRAVRRESASHRSSAR